MNTSLAHYSDSKKHAAFVREFGGGEVGGPHGSQGRRRARLAAVLKRVAHQLDDGMGGKIPVSCEAGDEANRPVGALARAIRDAVERERILRPDAGVAALDAQELSAAFAEAGEVLAADEPLFRSAERKPVVWSDGVTTDAVEGVEPRTSSAMHYSEAMPWFDSWRAAVEAVTRGPMPSKEVRAEGWDVLARMLGFDDAKQAKKEDDVRHLLDAAFERAVSQGTDSALVWARTLTRLTIDLDLAERPPFGSAAREHFLGLWSMTVGVLEKRGWPPSAAMHGWSKPPHVEPEFKLDGGVPMAA